MTGRPSASSDHESSLWSQPLSLFLSEISHTRIRHPPPTGDRLLATGRRFGAPLRQTDAEVVVKHLDGLLIVHTAVHSDPALPNRPLAPVLVGEQDARAVLFIRLRRPDELAPEDRRVDNAFKRRVREQRQGMPAGAFGAPVRDECCVLEGWVSHASVPFRFNSELARSSSLGLKIDQRGGIGAEVHTAREMR